MRTAQDLFQGFNYVTTVERKAKTDTGKYFVHFFKILDCNTIICKFKAAIDDFIKLQLLLQFSKVLPWIAVRCYLEEMKIQYDSHGESEEKLQEIMLASDSPFICLLSNSLVIKAYAYKYLRKNTPLKGKGQIKNSILLSVIIT